MNWSFRKSTNAISSSEMTRTGTKDTRTYVNLHADGIYYRKKITGNTSYTPSQPHTYYQQGDDNITQHTITSAPVDQLTDIDSKDFIDELNIKSGRSSYLNWFGILPAILFCIFLIAHYNRIAKVTYDKKYIVTIKEAKTGINIRLNPDKKSAVVGGAIEGDKFDLVDSTNVNWYEINHRGMNAYVSREYAFIDSLNINKRTYSGFEVASDSFVKWFLAGMLFFSLLFYQLKKIDKKRMLTEIYYDMDESIAELYEKFIAHFSELTQSKRVWQYLHSQYSNSYKYNAGAGKLITRIGVKSVCNDKKPSSTFITNVKVPNINLRNTQLYFFPERLIIKRNNHYAAVFYKSLTIDSKITRFIEEEPLSSDAVVVGHTWKYLNKNGTPDRRFNDNRQLPICSYSEYTIRSKSGVHEIITTSKRGAFDSFTHFIAAIGKFQNRMANALSESE